MLELSVSSGMNGNDERTDLSWETLLLAVDFLYVAFLFVQPFLCSNVSSIMVERSKAVTYDLLVQFRELFSLLRESCSQRLYLGFQP